MWIFSLIGMGIELLVAAVILVVVLVSRLLFTLAIFGCMLYVAYLATRWIFGIH